MFKVEVPKRNRRVWIESAEAILTPEAAKWLRTFVGIRQFRLISDEEYQPPEPHWIQLVRWHAFSIKHNDVVTTALFFSHAKHAALFKLTFL